MKIRYLIKIALPFSENQVNNFEKLITDADSSTPQNLWSNFMKIRYFVKIAVPFSENQVNNFEKLITDSDSSTPKTFDQTLWKFVILLK